MCVRVPRSAARRADWRLAWHRLRRASRAPQRAQARRLRHRPPRTAAPPPVQRRAARRRAAPPARRRRSTGRGRPTRAPAAAARQVPDHAPTAPQTATRARHRATRAAAQQVPARLLALAVPCALSDSGLQRSVSKVGQLPQRSLAGCGAGASRRGGRADAAVAGRGGGHASGRRARGRRAAAAAGEPGRAAALLPARGPAARAARRAAVPDLRLLLQVHAAGKARRSRPRGLQAFHRPWGCNETRSCWKAGTCENAEMQLCRRRPPRTSCKGKCRKRRPDGRREVPLRAVRRPQAQTWT